MKIERKDDEKKITLAVEGRLNTTNAHELDEQLEKVTEAQCEKLILDFKGLDYISSAGLKCVLSAQKRFNARGLDFVLKSVPPQILDVFEMTGFSDFLVFE